MDDSRRNKIKKRLIGQFEEILKSFRIANNRAESQWLMKTITVKQYTEHRNQHQKQAQKAALTWYRALSDSEKVAVVEESINNETLWVFIKDSVSDELCLYRTLVS